MLEYLPELLTVAGIHLLAVMSPGPDFIMISRAALIYSRRAGIFAAIGLGLGITVHVLYSLLGIALVIAQSVVLFTIIKYLGAGYLLYIGYKSLRAKPAKDIAIETVKKQKDISDNAAMRMGFLTNVLNPKATLFFLALFTQVIRPETPHIIQALYGVEMAIMTFAWFTVVALVLSGGIVRRKFVAIQHKAERVFGVILIALGVKVATTQ